MKKCSHKNEDLNNVETRKKSQVVGKWFVRVSRAHFVSICHTSAPLHLKKPILISRNETIFSKIEDARGMSISDQILGKNTKQIHNLTRSLRKIAVSWQYYNKNKKAKFFKNNWYLLGKIKCNNYSELVKGNIELLRCGDIEANPGPKQSDNSTKVDSKIGGIITYNTRGIKEYFKIKRIFNSCAKKLIARPLTIFN